jgi:hypothetical protein
MKPSPLRALAAPLAVSFAAALVAQSPITVERVRETVTWLAADERAGRETGSPELVAAGEWIAERFAKAGLQQVAEGSWFHEFPLTGWRLDSRALQLELVRRIDDKSETFTFVADDDVRQLSVADTLTGDAEPCTVARLDDPAMQRMMSADSARRLVVCEVAADDPRWLGSAGAHRVLTNKRQASRPLLLVRHGLLPPAPADGKAATWTAKWSAGEPEKVEIPQYNVLGVLRGAAKKDEFVVVSAHYDHIGIGAEVDGDRINNGADDNATGTTAVLLLAEALAKEPPLARSVLFVCFTGEERGLLGSKAFCARPPVPLEQIVVNVNFEMLGRPEPGNEGKAWITGAELSDFATIAGDALRRGGIQPMDFAQAGRLFTASDNWAFAQKGVVAHSISAGSLHPDYHGRNDEVDRLDVPHMTNVIRGLVEVVRDFANRAERPQWNERGRKRIERTSGR